MEIKGTWRREFEYRLIFNRADIEVLKAMAREQTHVHAEDDVLEEAPELLSEISTWRNERKRHTIHTNSLSEIAGLLYAFEQRTSEVVSDIPDITCLPAFNNELVTIRHRLGKHALTLLNQMHEREAADFSTADLDRAASKFLPGDTQK